MHYLHAPRPCGYVLVLSSIRFGAFIFKSSGHSVIIHFRFEGRFARFSDTISNSLIHPVIS
jgi:hypothetical protein